MENKGHKLFFELHLLALLLVCLVWLIPFPPPRYTSSLENEGKKRRAWMAKNEEQALIRLSRLFQMQGEFLACNSGKKYGTLEDFREFQKESGDFHLPAELKLGTGEDSVLSQGYRLKLFTSKDGRFWSAYVWPEVFGKTGSATFFTTNHPEFKGMGYSVSTKIYEGEKNPPSEDVAFSGTVWQSGPPEPGNVSNDGLIWQSLRLD